MTRLACFFIVVCLLCFGAAGLRAAASSERLTIDLAENYVDITTGFNGAHLVVFGAKKQPGELVVEVRGPKKDAVVRQKNKVLGVWMNTRFYRFLNIWSYYDFALSRDSLAEMGEDNQRLMREKEIGVDAAFFDHLTPAEQDVGVFQEALLKTKQKQGFYPVKPKPVKFLDDSLFRAEFYLPASVPKGKYKIVASLLSRGKIIDQQSVVLDVKQVGLSSYMNRFAFEHAFAYGCICILIAFFSGWGINLLRRGF